MKRLIACAALMLCSCTAPHSPGPDWANEQSLEMMRHHRPAVAGQSDVVGASMHQYQQTAALQSIATSLHPRGY